MILPNEQAAIPMCHWKIIKKFILKRHITRVIEFGSGLSTTLFDKGAHSVISYETKPEIIKVLQRKVKHTVFYLWHPEKRPVILNPTYELIFIDGPMGGGNRKPSYKLARDSGIPLVICHDTNRKHDKKLLIKYFSNYRVVARSRSAAGMMIMEKVKK